MLKKFFIAMLGSMAALWISFFLISILSVAFIASIVGISEKSEKVTKNSILYLNLTGSIAECNQEQSLLTMIQNFESESPTLADMISAINRAANDSKITCIYIDAAGSELGIASREELVEALVNFKKSGKKIIAYADNFLQGDYLVSSMADEIYLNPVGSVAINGVGSLTPFFTGLLDKLGVKVQVIKVGTYKSAVEPFILTSMSDAARHQNQVFIDSIWDYYTTTVARERGVEPSAVKTWADSLVFTWPAVKDLEADIVTKLAYRREVESRLKSLSGIEEDDELKLVTPDKYLADCKLASSSDSHIAVLYAVGDIVETGEEGIVGETIVPQIIELADDDNVAGLILRVNSGGGSAFTSEQIWEALEYFKSKEKPFYVSMGDYAASGGYYISCGADCIYADATTLTGSIGVFGMIPDLSGLVTGKLGVSFSNVSSTPNAGFPNVFEPLSDFQIVSMQRHVEQTYDIFTGRVAEGRHMSVDSVKAIAEGRVWVGSSAIELGLVDKIGSLTQAINDMAAELDLDKDDYVNYPDATNDLLKKLLGDVDIEAVAGMKLDSETLQYLQAVKRIREMSPIQARMPEITIR